ncbi:uncharacterized protein LOC131148497 isoform X2 [Malania oleifera]|uniref:uncharacterized protein LOC131148497 isoform X2 n=1 Tax=Malania oleifera TaxID=397392 RepID=UPI0025ADE9E8|nr:uncharacterized protein LOC131148497 isoform X2 [Malania oleifera]
MAAAESDPDLAAADTDLEFLYSNDSWYSVRLVLHADMLTVKYRDFPDIYDERFVPGGFKNADEVKRFRERFRPASLQLQDSECSKVERGMKVCASYSFKDDDVRFQDAIVEEVEFKKHAFRNGEEECLCIFMLSWLHGPKVGTMTATSVANICTLQSSANTNQTLNSFLNITMEKMKATLLTSDSDSKKGGDNGHLRSTAQAFEEIISNSWPKIEQDVDMGGETSLMNRITGYHHFVLIDNLEKDLSPRIVVEFIHKQTTISTQVCIFPSLSSETYTRGTIVSDCKENLEKLLKFLENPNHIITSSTGRRNYRAEILIAKN